MLMNGCQCSIILFLLLQNWRYSQKKLAVINDSATCQYTLIVCDGTIYSFEVIFNQIILKLAIIQVLEIGVHSTHIKLRRGNSIVFVELILIVFFSSKIGIFECRQKCRAKNLFDWIGFYLWSHFLATSSKIWLHMSIDKMFSSKLWSIRSRFLVDTWDFMAFFSAQSMNSFNNL